MGLDMYMRKYNKILNQEQLVKVNGLSCNLNDTNSLNQLLDDHSNMTRLEFAKEHLNYFEFDALTKRTLDEVVKDKKFYSWVEGSMEFDKMTEDSFNKYEDDRIKSLENELNDRINYIVSKAKDDLEFITHNKELLENLTNEELCYWRKHSDLNGLLEDMYYSRGNNEEFNCVPLILSEDDVKYIIQKHKDHLSGEDEIEEASGFFWGKTSIEDWKDSLADFEKVFSTTDFSKETLYYSCWW